MIENKTATSSKAKVTTKSSNATSPISRSYEGKAKKTNAFIAWLRDEETHKDGQISAKDAVVSFGKGLIECVKTIYKKPVLSAITITAGITLMVTAQTITFTPVMGICTTAGLAGIAYAVKSIIDKTSTTQAYELMGISSLVLALGIYGLLI